MARETLEEMSMSATLHADKSGTSYTVGKMGSKLKKHGGLKKGEKLSDTHVDDLQDSGVKVKIKPYKQTNEAIQRRMDRLTIIATDPATGRKVIKIAPKKEIEIGKGKQESYEDPIMGLFLNEERFITEGMSLVQRNFLGESYEEYCQNVAEFNDDLNKLSNVLSESNEPLNEETQLLNQQLVEMCEPGEDAQQLYLIREPGPLVAIPAALGAIGTTGARIGAGIAAKRAIKKYAPKVYNYVKNTAIPAAQKTYQNYVKPMAKKVYNKVADTVKKGVKWTKKQAGKVKDWVKSKWSGKDKAGTDLRDKPGKFKELNPDRIMPGQPKFRSKPDVISKAVNAIRNNPGKAAAAIPTGVAGYFGYKAGKAAYDKYQKGLKKLKDVEDAKTDTTPVYGKMYNSFDPRSVYNFETDLNENIIGATFAKGTNQGNFNNEVDAVRDALAQIQELSPQTISSYQKKAGKQYRQAKGERPMHPEYSAGLNAAGKMTDKDMEDSDKAYDTMKKRGRGLAMSKGKGVQKEEMLYELAPVAAVAGATFRAGKTASNKNREYQNRMQSLTVRPGLKKGLGVPRPNTQKPGGPTKPSARPLQKEEGLPNIGLKFNPKNIAKKIGKKLPPIGLRQKPVRSEEAQIDEIGPAGVLVPAGIGYAAGRIHGALKRRNTKGARPYPDKGPKSPKPPSNRRPDPGMNRPAPKPPGNRRPDPGMNRPPYTRNEEVQVDEIAPVLAVPAAAAAAAGYAAGRKIGKGIQNLKGKGIGKIGPDFVPKKQPKAPLKPGKPKSMPKPPAVGAGAAGTRPAKKPAPKYNEGNLGPRKAKAPKQMGPQNQMQSYDHGIEEGMRGTPQRKKMFSANISKGVKSTQGAKAILRGNYPPVKPKGNMWSEGAMKELVTKKQEDERLAKRKKDSEYSDKEVRMGKGVAFDKRYKGGNMTGAYKTINKIKKGLGDHPKVADALRRANEEFNNEGERNG